MALEVADVRQAIEKALKYEIASAVIDNDENEITKLSTIMMVVTKITDEAIDDALVALFVEASAKFNQ